MLIVAKMIKKIYKKCLLYLNMAHVFEKIREGVCTELHIFRICAPTYFVQPPTPSYKPEPAGSESERISDASKYFAQEIDSKKLIVFAWELGGKKCFLSSPKGGMSAWDSDFAI